MPVTYSIKRNSLSSRWCVWATESGSGSPVENLVAELKTKEHAESYCHRIEAGEEHGVIMASLIGKKPKESGGGGLFGKLFKRGASNTEAVSKVASESNPVIEIQATSKTEQPEDSPASEIAAEPVAATSEKPSRFQVIEQPPAPPVISEESVAVEASSDEQPVAEVGASVEIAEPGSQGIKTPVKTVIKADMEEAPAEQVEQPSTTTEQVEKEPEPVAEAKVASEAPVARQAQDAVEAFEAVEQPVAEQQSEPAPEPAPAPAKVAQQPVTAQEASRENGLLVDWTFTPPPDVTPEELRASGKKVVTKPAAAPNESKVDPEWAGPTGTDSVSNLSEDSQTGRMTVDICVSKALKDSAYGDSRISDKKYNSIASKEYTEVSKAFASGNSPEYLREELTHLAAVCMAWADAIEKRQADKKSSKAA